MNKSLLVWVMVSAFVHVLVIVLTSLLPMFVSLATNAPTFDNSDVALTEDLAEWDSEELTKFDDAPLIHPDSLNIDVVKISQIDKAFKPEVAQELNELIHIYKSDKISKEKANKKKYEKELSKAKKGLNVINTKPLGAHASVILENLDFTKEFDAEVSFRVNSDGSFRSIETTESSGWDVVDRSLENIFKELSAQKIAFFTNFRRMTIFVDSDGEDLTLKVYSYLKDSLKASSIYFLLTSVVASSKANNKTDEETMTILNNLSLEQNDNTVVITVGAKSLFVMDAIKD